MRVLLIKTSSLGDVIHPVAALTDGQRATPGIRFDWVVEEGCADIPGWHPAVDEVIPVAIRRWRKNFLKTWRSGEWRAFKGKLASRQYDLIIDAQGLLKSAMLTRLNDAPAAGYDRQSIREPIASRFYNRCYSVSRQLHAVERIRQLFASALDYPLPREVGDYGIDLSRLPTVVAPQQPFVVFCHGTTWKTKHWPESYWRQLAEKESRQGRKVLLPWGNEVEKARAERIAEGLRQSEVLQKLSLWQVAGLLSQGQQVVVVDTELGHLTASIGNASVE